MHKGKPLNKRENLQFQKRKFLNAYWYAHLLFDLLSDPCPFGENLRIWFAEDSPEYLLRPFPTWSILHSIIHHTIHENFYDDELFDCLNDIQNGEKNTRASLFIREPLTWLDKAFRLYSIETPTFDEEVDWRNTDNAGAAFEEWYDELIWSEPYDRLLKSMARDVFSVVFPNKMFLYYVNVQIAALLPCTNFTEPIDKNEFFKFATPEGYCSRVAIPSWVKRAVTLRDRGLCAYCSKDLTGLISSHCDPHFDHVIPLSDGGINDVTNIQMLCSKCNLQKGKKRTGASEMYESWYADHDDTF